MFSGSTIRSVHKIFRILLVLDANWVRALRMRVAAGVEHCEVLRLLGRCNTVVDVGANRGQFTLAARHVWPDARIIAFEPLSPPARKFETVFSEDDGIVLHRKAVGPDTGKKTIHISQRDDSSSLLQIGPEQVRIFRGTEEVESVEIDATTLTDALPPDEIRQPALLKLDVQGYELEALKGCEDVVDRFEFIYCECSFRELYKKQSLAGDVIVWLGARGFNLCGIYHMSYDRNGAAVQADFLFARPPRAAGGAAIAPGGGHVKVC
jgi:FkbM family methyltransferase